MSESGGHLMWNIYYPGICLEVPRKPRKILSKNSQCSGRD